MGQLFVQESVWDNFVSRLRVRVGHLHVGEAFDHLADVGSPLSKDIIANLTAATSMAQKNGLEVPVELYDVVNMYIIGDKMRHKYIILKG